MRIALPRIVPYGADDTSGHITNGSAQRGSANRFGDVSPGLYFTWRAPSVSPACGLRAFDVRAAVGLLGGEVVVGSA